MRSSAEAYSRASAGAGRKRRRLWREASLVGAVLSVVAIADLALSRFGFDILEEGFFLSFARRVQLGDVPYRDFSLPYTPGVVYLYARAFEWFGPDVIVLRWIEIGAQLILFLGLYLVGRQLLPPVFAAIPPLMIAGMETVPELWSLHPGWYSAGGSLCAVLAVAQYLKHGRAWYLVGAGAASALSFAFKQNLGLLSLIAILWLVVVAEPHLPAMGVPWPSRLAAAMPPFVRRGFSVARVAIQGAALVLLPLAGVALARQHWTVSVIAILVVPLAALSTSAAARIAFRRVSPDQRPPCLAGEVSFYVRPLLVLAGFGAITVPWLAVLVAALGGHVELLGAFVGAVDTAGYFLPFQGTSLVDYLLLGFTLLVPAVVALAARRSDEGRRRSLVWLSVLAGCSLPIASVYVSGGLAAPHAVWAAAAPAWSGYAETGIEPGSGGLFAVLPTLAFWAGLARLMLVDLAHTGPLTRRTVLRLWYLSAGSVLLLHQYPRMDVEHLLWCGGPLLVIGAELLSLRYLSMLRRVRVLRSDAVARLGLGLSVILLPAVAMVSEGRDRLAGAGEFLMLASSRATDPDRSLVQLTRVGGGAPVWVLARQGAPLQQLVGTLRAQTAPGEPIFAYPVIPGIYYLADRPNPTHFNHLFTGMATLDEQGALIRQLDGVRYVVWDAAGIDQWIQPPGNPLVENYIHDNFTVDGVSGFYTLLKRTSSGVGAEEGTRTPTPLWGRGF